MADLYETPSDSLSIAESQASAVEYKLNLVDFTCCFDDDANATTHIAGTGTVNVGTEILNTQVAAQAEDGVLWVIQETVTTPGLDVEWDFDAGIRTPEHFHFVGKYQAHPSYTANIDAWNYVTLGWDTIGVLSYSNTIQNLFFDLTSQHEDASHNLNIRIQHTGEGRVIDEIYIDHVGVFVFAELPIILSKVIEDSIAINEAISKFEVNTSKTESVSIAEQLANLATIGISDTQSVTESINLLANFKREFSDSRSIVEAIAKAIRPFLADSQSLAESISKIAVQLNLTASQTFAEEMAKNIALGKTDTLGIAEAVAKAIGLYKTDAQPITEAEAWFFNKIISDAVTFADASQLFDVTQEAWWGLVKWRTACHSGL